MMLTQNTNNAFSGGNNSSLQRSPYSQYNGIPKASPGGFGGGRITQGETFMQTQAVNEDNLRCLSGTDSDPIALFLGTINKLHFLSNSLPPSLNKDHRLVQVETFYKEIFSRS